MNLYNNKVTYRVNHLLRNIVIKKKRNQLQNKDFTILCNNCNAGILLHDLKLRFDTPTINMFFHGTDFFDFIEHIDYYININLTEKNPTYHGELNYPIGILKGEVKYKDLELHFLHYRSFEEAYEKWETRKKRIHWDNLFLMWTFFGSMSEQGNEIFYKRVQNLPIKNKVIFVNHPVDKYTYPNFFYIKGFENQEGLGVLSQFMNLKGEYFLDQFNYVDWLNKNK